MKDEVDQLLVAAIQGDVPGIVALLNRGVDPNGVDKRAGQSALYNATRANQIGAVNSLMQMGADPNLRMNCRSFVDGREERGVVALMYATSDDVARALIDGGADVNATSDVGVTPLMLAAHRANELVVQLLLDNRADASIRLTDGSTAADFARSQIARYESWVVGADRTPIAGKVERLQRICSLLEQATNHQGDV